MRIIDVRQMTVPISSPLKNAYIDFSKMDVSVIAVITDVERDGRRVVGYGFNSNGRYAPHGLLRDRFIPRLMEAESQSLLTEDGEKSGGHGVRSVAVGVIDMAVWDVVAKIEGKPLYRVLADRYRNGEADDRVWVYAAGGYYEPGKDLAALQDEMRGYLGLGYTTVKMKIGGAPLDEDLRRIEAVLEVVDGDGSRLAVDANGRFDLETAIAYANALTPYGLRWYEEAGDPLDYELQAKLGEVYPNTLAT